MNVVVPTLICFILYGLGYFFYSRFLALKLYGLNDQRVTPAHTLEDGVDYVPSRKSILFGHHFASIAGLGPLLGPAVAVIWGWVPAMIWVVVGAILIGCVHDFSALVLSIRAKGLSIAMVAEGVMGKRAKTL
ncbi:MAG: carbon starvation CstA family protein, partial [Myxococcota bacterium]|nr:carbon starvation CstA family protein [Myxococcota bacterium]